MSTTIDALRNLGLKVNGEEPQSNYVNNVINEIADNYSPSEAGMSNPMTTAGDIIVGGTSGAPTRLAAGTQGQVLSVGSSGLEWANASSGGGPEIIELDFTNAEIVSDSSFELALVIELPQATYDKINFETDSNIDNYNVVHVYFGEDSTSGMTGSFYFTSIGNTFYRYKLLIPTYTGSSTQMEMAFVEVQPYSSASAPVIQHGAKFAFKPLIVALVDNNNN